MKEKIKKYYEEHKEEIEKMAKKAVKVGGIAALAVGSFALGSKWKSLEWDTYLAIICSKDPNFKVLDLLDSEKVNQIFNVVTTE